MKKEFIKKIYDAHKICPDCPGPDRISRWFEDLIGTLFPDFKKKQFDSPAEVELHLKELESNLVHMVYKGSCQEEKTPDEVASKFFMELPGLHEMLSQDVQAMYAGDPAANSNHEVIRSYPGFYAIAAYRVAHQLYNDKVNVIPRIITEHAHSKTGIDIHPGARIGRFFCIDHGTGVVIGETTHIGNHVKIYQGVTLGALSVSKEQASTKRHPTIEDNVTIYAGATILGGDTVVGESSIIGGNVWLTKSIPPHTRMYYKAAMQDEDTGKTDTVIYKTNS